MNILRTVFEVIINRLYFTKDLKSDSYFTDIGKSKVCGVFSPQMKTNLGIGLVFISIPLSSSICISEKFLTSVLAREPVWKRSLVRSKP